MSILYKCNKYAVDSRNIINTEKLAVDENTITKFGISTNTYYSKTFNFATLVPLTIEKGKYITTNITINNTATTCKIYNDTKTSGIEYLIEINVNDAINNVNSLTFLEYLFNVNDTYEILYNETTINLTISKGSSAITFSPAILNLPAGSTFYLLMSSSESDCLIGSYGSFNKVAVSDKYDNDSLITRGRLQEMIIDWQDNYIKMQKYYVPDDKLLKSICDCLLFEFDVENRTHRILLKKNKDKGYYFNSNFILYDDNMNIASTEQLNCRIYGMQNSIDEININGITYEITLTLHSNYYSFDINANISSITSISLNTLATSSQYYFNLITPYNDSFIYYKDGNVVSFDNDNILLTPSSTVDFICQTNNGILTLSNGAASINGYSFSLLNTNETLIDYGCFNGYFYSMIRSNKIIINKYIINDSTHRVISKEMNEDDLIGFGINKDTIIYYSANTLYKERKQKKIKITGIFTKVKIDDEGNIYDLNNNVIYNKWMNIISYDGSINDACFSKELIFGNRILCKEHYYHYKEVYYAE